jgi:uroporphyrinogen III methyltransferase / synthase
MSAADIGTRWRVVVTRKGTGLGVMWLAVSASRIRSEARTRFARLLRRHTYDWIAVTSGSAVPAIGTAWRRLASSPRIRRVPKVAAVGPGTAEHLRARGVPVSLEGPGPGGAALAEAILRAGAQRGTRIIWPRASHADLTLARILRAHHVTVTDLAVYDLAAINNRGLLAVDRALRARRVTAICFTAPSAVARVFARLSPTGRKAARRLPAGSFGPATTAALRGWGINDVIEVNRGRTGDRVKQLVAALADHRRRAA